MADGTSKSMGRTAPEKGAEGGGVGGRVRDLIQSRVCHVHLPNVFARNERVGTLEGFARAPVLGMRAVSE